MTGDEMVAGRTLVKVVADNGGAIGVVGMVVGHEAEPTVLLADAAGEQAYRLSRCVPLTLVEQVEYWRSRYEGQCDRAACLVMHGGDSIYHAVDNRSVARVYPTWGAPEPNVNMSDVVDDPNRL